MHKKKILFVVVDFFKGGAERFAYEVDKALDKNKFNVDVFCLGIENNTNKEWERYYDKKHEELGSKVIYSDSFRRKKTNNRIKNKIKKFFKFKRYNHFKEEKLLNFLNNYDLIHFMGEYTMLHFLPKNILKKSVIYSMSHKFQNKELYNKFDFNYNYNFISTFNKSEQNFEYSDFKKINHHFFPLILEISNNKPKWEFIKPEIFKIGIFTRLDKYKPLDPFIYSFQLLLEKLPNCQLHIFGNGNPETTGVIRYVKHLGLTDSIFFRGHQEDIIKTALSEKINISWFQGYNNSKPAGYAGLDICSVGIPLLCWDFYDKPIKERNFIFPHFKNLNSFVDESVQILLNKKAAETLSNSQFTKVKKERDANLRIVELEDIYIKIIKKNN